MVLDCPTPLCVWPFLKANETYTADTGVWSSANEPGVRHSTLQTVIGVPCVTALPLGVVYQSFTCLWLTACVGDKWIDQLRRDNDSPLMRISGEVIRQRSCIYGLSRIRVNDDDNSKVEYSRVVIPLQATSELVLLCTFYRPIGLSQVGLCEPSRRFRKGKNLLN